MSSFDSLYMVTYFDFSTSSEERIVFNSSSLVILFEEIIDMLGDDGLVYNIELLHVTDLDVTDLDVKEIVNNEV